MDTSETLNPGLSATLSARVTEENVAAAWGSGNLPVFATPAMIALMESAAAAAVQDKLPPGCSTVGTELKVRHLSPTPVGLEVRAVAELVEQDRRRLSFKVEAWDPAGKIGEGTHERFIVENDRFLKKARERTES
jgi:predicted thioesterase